MHPDISQCCSNENMNCDKRFAFMLHQLAMKWHLYSHVRCLVVCPCFVSQLIKYISILKKTVFETLVNHCRDWSPMCYISCYLTFIPHILIKSHLLKSKTLSGVTNRWELISSYHSISLPMATWMGLFPRYRRLPIGRTLCSDIRDILSQCQEDQWWAGRVGICFRFSTK